MMTMEAYGETVRRQQEAEQHALAAADQRAWEAIDLQRRLEASCDVSYDDDGNPTYTPREQ
jgi:uncharacterized protein YecT (DUF1311 family)